MPLDEAVLEDIKLAIPAVKKRRGLEFYLIPSKKLNDPPWLIIDKASKVRVRVAKATRLARQLKTFAIGKTVMGRLLVVNKRLCFVVAEEPSFPLAAKLTRMWPAAYMAEEDKDINRLGKLLKKSRVLTEEEALDIKETDEDEDYGEELSPEDLLDIFGDDAEEVGSSAVMLHKLNGHLDELLEDTGSTETTGALLEGVLQAAGSDLSSELAKLVPTFLKMAQTELPLDGTTLSTGSKVRVKDQILELADLYNRYEQSLAAWEELVATATDVLKHVTPLDVRHVDKDDLDEDEAALRTMLARQYESARLGGLSAKATADKLRGQIGERMEALQKTASTSSTSTL